MDDGQVRHFWRRYNVFFGQVRFFFIALMLSLNRTEGVNGSLNFLSMEQTGLKVNVTCGQRYFCS